MLGIASPLIRTHYGLFRCGSRIRLHRYQRLGDLLTPVGHVRKLLNPQHSQGFKCRFRDLDGTDIKVFEGIIVGRIIFGHISIMLEPPVVTYGPWWISEFRYLGELSCEFNNLETKLFNPFYGLLPLFDRTILEADGPFFLLDGLFKSR